MSLFSNDKNRLIQNIYHSPKACLIDDNNSYINYHKFLLSDKGKAARESLYNIYPHISLNKINYIVDNVSNISSIRRDFYKLLLFLRIEHIIKPAYKLACDEHNVTTSIPNKFDNSISNYYELLNESPLNLQKIPMGEQDEQIINEAINACKHHPGINPSDLIQYTNEKFRQIIVNYTGYWGRSLVDGKYVWRD